MPRSTSHLLLGCFRQEWHLHALWQQLAKRSACASSSVEQVLRSAGNLFYKTHTKQTTQTIKHI